ncbi:hypothetical protein DTW90_34460 [Neorhizobium sp. P12A]|uniref:hypothetical protein n=1 Tax=Neorhizobium sp. P12A TaxID=2268027 RepID=UPI0011EBCD99|nr:hypothetical protein [Neorhizobium sp. P12A]KAA0685992.1 hypothetical protein DTW90_34460 [Neorhizobium sp. P12A]
MHRHIVYPGQIPLDTDILNAIKDAYYGVGWLAESLIGTSIATVGLAVTPTVPASLQVNVAPGAIYSLQTVDSSAYGSLGTDTNQFVKQGIFSSSTTLPAITPPGTVGQSQNFLVQVAFSETDSNPVVLPYYNASNPSVAWSGPNNSGTAQNTVRKDSCVVQLKAGTPATTGSQTTPAPDAGFVGIYVITVANGATTITSGNISLLATAPFFPTLPQIPGAVQANTWVGFDDTGAANALVISPNPPIKAYAKYQEFAVKLANSITGSSTINVSGLGAVALVDSSGAPTIPGIAQAGDILRIINDGTNFRIAGGNTISSTAFVSSNLTTQTLNNNNPTVLAFATSGGTLNFATYTTTILTFSRAGIYVISGSVIEGLTFTGTPGTSGSIEIRKNGVAIIGSHQGQQSNQASPVSFFQSASVVISAVAGDQIAVVGAIIAASGFTAGSATSVSLSVTPIS